MSSGTIGEIRLFAGNFAPRDWAFCNGQLMSIAANSALFSILGTTYGGNGTSTFALPDLRGRVPVGVGQGPGLSNRQLGEASGQETVTLTQANLPSHSHTLAAGGMPTTSDPAGAYLPTGTSRIYGPGPATTQLAPATIGLTGQNVPVNNVQPYLGMSYVICLYGIYPARN